ncbi:MAG: hypothetical protein E7596_02245 [Ruminococcaceae bacterium]|nr:hypothetical protein [Oscillospiraceae bacterium]
MAKKVFKATISFILIAIMAIGMVGCEKPSDEEAVSLVKDLVSRSYELNVIYYGEGLKYKDSGNPNDIYMVVFEQEKYILKSQLTKATREVFSESFATSIIDMSFNGIQSSINQNSVQPRYMTQIDDDLLFVNRTYEPVVDKIAEYNYDTIEILKISRRFIEAEIKTTTGELVTVILIKEDNGWRLDSGTY